MPRARRRQANTGQVAIVLVPEQLAVLGNGVDDSLATGKDILETGPAPTDIFGTFQGRFAVDDAGVLVPLENAVLGDGVDDSVAA